MITTPLRIGVDGGPLAERLTGVPRYVIELCRRLDFMMPNSRFFIYGARPVRMPVDSCRWISRILPLRGPLKGTRWLTLHGARRCERDDLDVFWGANSRLPLKLSPKIKTVVTVYDLAQEVSPGSLTWSSQFLHYGFLPASLKRADAVVTISRGTAERLRRAYGYEASSVIPPGVSEVFRRPDERQISRTLEKYRVKRPYLLNVTAWEPKKNIELLIEVFVAMKAAGLLPLYSLVLAGSARAYAKRLANLVRASAQHGVVALGYVDEEDLPALYSGCDAFVFPSAYEGFGMPVAEARACGARVVTTDIPELHEAAGFDAVYVALERDSLHRGILEALASPAPPYMALHNWDESATRLATVLTNVCM